MRADAKSDDIKTETPVYFGVVTTGIYCRLGCPVRPPKPENIRPFATVEAARQAGFRPCKRCRPDDPIDLPVGALSALPWVVSACRMMAAYDEAPKLSDMASAFGLSPAHFQRRFKAALGLSPKAYASAVRRQRLNKALPRAASITEALYAAGYGSAARFYEDAERQLGMSVGARRAKGLGERIDVAVGEAGPLGHMLIAKTRKGICLVRLGNDPDALLEGVRADYEDARFMSADESIRTAIAQVVTLIKEPDAALHAPLDIRGTAFQQRVWAALQTIPRGQTLTYSQLADTVGAPKAVRAVASACAANNHAIAIPCHRIVRADGGLGGYRWGLELKKQLLEFEKVAPGKD